MIRIVAAVVVAACLASCDVVGAMKRLVERSNQAANEIQALTGSKPDVSFRYESWELTSVTVTFPKPLDTDDLPGLTRTIRRAVEARFQQKPKVLVVGFRAADE